MKLTEYDIETMFRLRYLYGMSVGYIAAEYEQRPEFTAKVLKGERLRKWSRPLFDNLKECESDEY